MDAALLDRAKQLIPEPDYILDLYDLTFTWGSPKLLALSGYSVDDFNRLKSTDVVVFNHNFTEEQYRRILNTRVAEKGGVVDLPTRLKDGTLAVMNVYYRTFEHDGVWYIVGKVQGTSPFKQETTDPVAS